MTALQYQEELNHSKNEPIGVKFANGYEVVTDWFENLRILLPVLIISGVHYTKVLWEHDGPFLAPLIAIVLDVTHFNSLKKLVQAKSPAERAGWGLASILTTAWAFALQYSFYAEGWVFKVDAVIYAGLVPLIVVVTAFREVKIVTKRTFTPKDLASGIKLPALDSFTGTKREIINLIDGGLIGLSRSKLADHSAYTAVTIGNHVKELVQVGVLIDDSGLHLNPAYEGIV